jgi:hypothetical protein
MTIQVDAVLDLETEGWDQFVVGGVRRGDFSKFYQTEWRGPTVRGFEPWAAGTEVDLVHDLLKQGGHVWTWNGGLFDSLWLAQEFRRRGLRVASSMAGARIVRLECEGLTVHDGFALFPRNLVSAARLAGVMLDKRIGLECTCGKRCGGYCRIRRDMPPLELALVVEYLAKDLEATWLLMRALQDEGARLELDLRGTVGSTAWHSAQKLCDLPDAHWEDWRDYRFARHGYKGGRIEVFRPSARGYQDGIGPAPLVDLDLNSAYPAALVKTAVPIGESFRLTGERAARAFALDRPGIYLASVVVPRMPIPPLPVRTPSGRLVFPIGPFEGVWPLPELRLAVEVGAAVAIRRALVWEDERKLFDDFVAPLYAERDRARSAGQEALADFLKWLMNSFTGKLAENPQHERIVICPDEGEVKICTCARGREECRCHPWRDLDLDGEVWAVPFWRISECGHVHWAAYLTAATRIELWRQLVADGQHGLTAVYCDTDNVIATAPRERNLDDHELGAWKTQTPLASFLALAPKVYRKVTVDGEVVVRGKGLPGLDSAGFDALLQGEPWTSLARGVRPLKSAARLGKLFTARPAVTRRLDRDGVHFGGRRLHGDLTHPQSYGEIRSWERGPRR